MECPICKLANACLAGTPNVSSCWCMNKQFDEWVLSQIPEQYKHKACICEACYVKYSEMLQKPQR
ncbi:cysteine-rich CWC family protein [Caryophanon latum]|uniref:cysteine-rich CWC family protein n=1 Tax=Caryophanon latum TaxID=33977 RepID=UPI0014711FA3|nr:cysteine-rich CWC family protein [Caryophanon latum]